jgi:hypothetical protein
MRHYATSREVAGSTPDAITFLSNVLILLAAVDPGVYSASNRNEYQRDIIMFLGSKADNLTASCERFF